MCGAGGMQIFDGLDHGADVFRRAAAAASKDTHAERSSVAGKIREIIRRRFRINDAVANAFGESGIGHGAQRQFGIAGGISKLAENWQEKLRADGAIRANDLNVFRFHFRGGVFGARAVKRAAFFRKSELRDDGGFRKGADGVDGAEQFVEGAKRLENEEIDTALFESEGLFTENFADFFGRELFGLALDAKRANRAGDQDFMARGFAGFAGEFDAAVVQLRDAVAKADGREFVAIGAEGVGLENLRAGFEIRLMDAEDGFWLRGIELVEAALRAKNFVEYRAHGAIGDQDGVAKALVEFLDFHCVRRS